MTYEIPPPPIRLEDHMIPPKKIPPDLKEKKVTTGFLSPVQTVVIGDDSFNYHARLNTNCYWLSPTITNYHVFWTCANSI